MAIKAGKMMPRMSFTAAAGVPAAIRKRAARLMIATLMMAAVGF
jgi:hypothetical protein